MDTVPAVSVLQAKLQAWCAGLLAIVVDAYQLGAVLGKGALVETGAQPLSPDVTFVPAASRNIVAADRVRGAPALAIDLIHHALPEADRAALCRRYADRHVLEYWQIEVDTAQSFLYQASANWEYDLIRPDNAGMHFSAAIVELSFPVKWFREQPGVWQIMERLGMIHD